MLLKVKTQTLQAGDDLGGGAVLWQAPAAQVLPVSLPQDVPAAVGCITQEQTWSNSFNKVQSIKFSYYSILLESSFSLNQWTNQSLEGASLPHDI